MSKQRTLEIPKIKDNSIPRKKETNLFKDLSLNKKQKLPPPLSFSSLVLEKKRIIFRGRGGGHFLLVFPLGRVVLPSLKIVANLP